MSPEPAARCFDPLEEGPCADCGHVADLDGGLCEDCWAAWLDAWDAGEIRTAAEEDAWHARRKGE